jgi:molecular chaperone GrpE
MGSDPKHGTMSSAPSSGLGDGDLADGFDHEMAEPVDAAPATSAHDATARAALDGNDDDAPDRASEVDDVTDAIARPGSPDGGATTGSATMEGAVDTVDAADVAELLAERDEYKLLAQRIQADFDNFRKRSMAQAQIDADQATGRLAASLLPVLDAAEAAYLRHPDEVGPLLNQMLQELRKQGLEPLDLDGQPFDPEVAEAVAHEAGDGGDPVVADVLRSGYLWKGRVLRAAMVRTRD